MADPRYSLFAARAVFDPRLSPTDVRVLAALGTYTDKQGWCRPKQETVALRIGVARTTVLAAIKRLTAIGYLEHEHQTVAGRGRSASRYRVKLDVEEPMSEPMSDMENPMSVETTSAPDVRNHVVPADIGGVPDVRNKGGPMSSPTNSQEEHSQEHSQGRERGAREGSDEVTPQMLDALKVRAEGAINLANANVHHPAALRQLLREGCVWQDIEDATDAAAGAIRAKKGRPFYSWAFIREGALQNRDRRAQPIAPMGEVKPPRPGRASYSDTIQRVAKEMGIE